MIKKPITTYYKTHVNYTITICPNDKYQFFGQHNRFKKFRAFMYEQLININAQYDMIIELSEPRNDISIKSNGPRLHTHGIIKWKNQKQLINFLMDDMYKILRFSKIEIDTIEDIKMWSKYCCKQRFFKKNLQNEPLLIITKPLEEVPPTQ